jgi:hypothetical protein
VQVRVSVPDSSQGPLNPPQLQPPHEVEPQLTPPVLRVQPMVSVRVGLVHVPPPHT